jgi:transposase-like protein
MANTKENEKERARELYFTTGWRQAQIAKEVGVSEKTISTWAIEGNWRAIKKANFHSSKVEIQRLYEELRVISVNISKREPALRFPTKEELDARTKILALINAWDKVKDGWRDVHDDHELTIPQDFNITPTETKTPQTSIPQ